MANLGFGFDPSAVEPREDFDILPDGWQEAHIVESEVRPTSSGTGQRACFTWEITAGPFERRRVWQNINVVNQSEKAQEIGQRELSGVVRGVGITTLIEDTEELHFRPAMIKIGKEKDDRGGWRNVVKSVKGLGDTLPGDGAAPARPAAPAPAARPASGPSSRPLDFDKLARPAPAAARTNDGAGRDAAPPARPSGMPWGGRR